MTHQNRLAFEKSPYLLQHKNNPVDWYPWGEEAFEKARCDNKLIFLSIGYSTCHWCHVMEHDSFEKQEVADVLNKYYVSIKVDREERPDIDQIYMEAVMAMTGSGGWPLSSFLTPDQKPFFGGTFFWKDQFMALLKRVDQVWREEPQKLIGSADELTTHLMGGRGAEEKISLTENHLKEASKLFAQSFDSAFGGFGPPPKFPRSIDLSLLLRIHRRTQNAVALQMVDKTLEMMARGGMYDHLGGGFHRYSTDGRWLVPHFEKMLTDNALLAVTYLEGYQVTKKEMYADVAREILDYVLRDMTSPDGGFYSAEDADSEGEEGKFYVWTESELKNILSAEEFEKLSAVYAVTSAGNFSAEGGPASGGEHTNILHLYLDFDWPIKKDPLIVSAHRKLLAIRDKRMHPYKDDKVLTSWNGLMITALAKGYQVLRDEKYLKAAQDAALFIEKNLFKDNKLLRRYRDGEARFDGYLEDYAFLIQALLELTQSDFDPRWFDWALALQKEQDDLFWDSSAGGYYFSVQASDLIVRKKETHDGATPSGNSMALFNLLHLHSLTSEHSFLDKAKSIFAFISSPIERYPPAYSLALIALDYHLSGPKEIVVLGKKEDPKTKDFLKFLQQTFLPHQVIAFHDSADSSQIGPSILEGRKALGGETTIYVCEGNVCKAPTTDLEVAKKLINDPLGGNRKFLSS